VTADVILAAVAVGIFLLSCVVSWQLILTLRQARATALAMEQIINGARPRIEAACDRLNALMTRADRMLAAAEGGGGAVGAILGAVGPAVAGWRTGARAISTISALIAGIVQAWSSLSKPREAAAPAPAGGPRHE
jgi:hypothetical protein